MGHSEDAGEPATVWSGVGDGDSEGKGDDEGDGKGDDKGDGDGDGKSGPAGASPAESATARGGDVRSMGGAGGR